ncbi:HNH endonuclease [Acidithiobacillus ferrivorans]|uniref:HNH endonuclease n=1 Tax=Acidithiobacillus ferrivorans TaxID=160808 RepID=UPI001C07538E|nr:HNH endonuclease signature motif containing protein [Acidithiobacillus ferrivorans]MBU2851646.1 HNH endonuclease [Acidithiobacillus ferrivorans]
MMDIHEFIVQFQDNLAPKLDTYEQAIYLYIFRHSRFLGLDEVTIGFKSARTRIATGTGENGKPMSENTAYLKLASLQTKGLLTIVRTNHAGRVLRLHLPSEIPDLITVPDKKSEIDIETMDFFVVHENRALLLKREDYRCFYTLQDIDNNNFVVEHVVSRPVGNNSYRNCVAASREANNKKGAMSAEDFLRRLFREGYLSDAEFQGRIIALEKLKAGELRPPLKVDSRYN